MLRSLVETTRTQCEKLNTDVNVDNSVIDPMNAIHFHKEGTKLKKSSGTVSARANLLNGAYDWELRTDLDKMLIFPSHIAITNKRPDLIIWSDSIKRVLLVELTVPWEANLETAYERKREKYEPLRAECEDRGWVCKVLPVEVGCRGYIARSITSYLRGIGLTGREQRKATKELQLAAETASSWIWQSAKRPGTT